MSIQKEEMTNEIPALYYPQIRGIAQPIRNLFYYLDIKYIEIPISNVRQLQAGFNSGFPKLVQGQIQLTDTIAIFRHLSRYYNRPDLLGLTPQNKASINQFLFHYADIRSKTIKKISEGSKIAWGKQKGEIHQIKINILKTIVQQECKILKDFLQYYMKNKGWLYGYLTIADFFFYQICFYLYNFLGSVMKNSLIYRNFQNFVNLFESQEFFQKHKEEILSRKIFMPFKDNKSALQIMASFWEGDKSMMA